MFKSIMNNLKKEKNGKKVFFFLFMIINRIKIKKFELK